jgi:hypothetical protein
VSARAVLGRAQELAKKLLTGSASATVDQPPDVTHPSVYVSFIVPLPAHGTEFAQFKGAISNWLADEHEVYQYGVVEGDGVDLTQTQPDASGDRYLQVGVLYGIPEMEQPKQIPAPRASVGEAGESQSQPQQGQSQPPRGQGG